MDDLCERFAADRRGEGEQEETMAIQFEEIKSKTEMNARVQGNKSKQNKRLQ